MIEWIFIFQWEIFVGIEILSYIFLLAFLAVRYILGKQRFSQLFLISFILCIFLEAGLAILIYGKTGEISVFQIVIGFFVVYACTLGISDFRKLDRYIKSYVGNWRGVNLLTEEDIQKTEAAEDPVVIARKSRKWWYVHTSLFIIAHAIFWIVYGNHTNGFIYYIKDLSWWGENGIENGPFINTVIAQISKLWILVFAIDTIIAWSYTLFPKKTKKNMTEKD